MMTATTSGARTILKRQIAKERITAQVTKTNRLVSGVHVGLVDNDHLQEKETPQGYLSKGKTKDKVGQSIERI